MVCIIFEFLQSVVPFVLAVISLFLRHFELIRISLCCFFKSWLSCFGIIALLIFCPVFFCFWKQFSPKIGYLCLFDFFWNMFCLPFCLRSVNLLPITYQFVFLDLLVLNRILTRKLPIEAEQFWQISYGHPETRSNEKIFLYSNECNRQRCRSNFFNKVTNFNNSMSLARDFPSYNPY